MASDLSTGQRAAVRAAKRRRAELGLTQKQLAERAGVHFRTVQDFERAITWPHVGTLEKIEKLGLEWPVDYLARFADREDAPGLEEPAQAEYSFDEAVQRIMRLPLSDQEKKLMIASVQVHNDGRNAGSVANA